MYLLTHRFLDTKEIDKEYYNTARKTVRID